MSWQEFFLKINNRPVPNKSFLAGNKVVQDVFLLVLIKYLINVLPGIFYQINKRPAPNKDLPGWEKFENQLNLPGQQ